MADHPTHFRVFLGSPGDLPDERELAPKVIAAINRELGEVFNCHIDLTKWEDTPPASEEPQDYINRLLNKCDIFVGMLHQKWGMPTSHYTSGFLEEYELCRTRRINEGKPEILLFFKEIELPEWQRADPHPDIKKVLEFKERVMNVDKFKYVPFEHPAGFGERLRAAIIERIIHYQGFLLSSTVGQKVALSDDSTSLPVSPPADNSPLSAAGARFAKDLIAKSETLGPDDRLSPFEIARFRLLGTAIGGQENDTRALGVHDSNLLYRRGRTTEFGKTELQALVAAGVELYAHQVAPLWHWCSRLPPLSLVT